MVDKRFEILIHELAEDELQRLRAFDRCHIMDEIELQLTHQPAVATSRRKRLESLTPTFEHVPPIWELRVGAFRVFYDIDDELKQVNVRAVRSKPPERTTEQII